MERGRPPPLAPRCGCRGGAVPPARVCPARAVRGRGRDRRLRAPLRARPRAGVRALRAARRRGRRGAVRVAALGLGDLDGPGRNPCVRQRAGGAPMRRGALMLLALAMPVAASCTTSSPEPIRIGAVYPLSGAQGPGGVDEFDGVQIAVQLVNADGGVDGRPIELVPVDTPGADAAPGAIAQLHDDGVRLVLGSYGSTISEPAAEASARRDMLFWETGAVGEMTGRGAGELVFRVAPSGAILGRNAISFVADEYAPVLGVDPTKLRYAVTLVDDAYGRSVARGALDELAARNLDLVGRFGYDPRGVNMHAFVRDLTASRPDVVSVSTTLTAALS